MIAKRLFDLLAAAAGLVAASPLLLAIAVAIALGDGSPVLFRQRRVGRHGRVFEILKFRTMRGAAGPQVSANNDPRITRIGAWLRKTKLDELPQLLNVLAGDMSLVGPRPEVEKYVAMYPEDARREVLSVRPGITDQTAIDYIDEGSLLASAADPEAMYVNELMPLKIASYRRYVRERTFAGDLRILFRTLGRIFR